MIGACRGGDDAPLSLSFAAFRPFSGLFSTAHVRGGLFLFVRQVSKRKTLLTQSAADAKTPQRWICDGLQRGRESVSAAPPPRLYPLARDRRASCVIVAPQAVESGGITVIIL